MFMKKKFINGLLMVAMFVGATSSLVSCKDYDDERNVNLQEQFAKEDTKLKDLINQLDQTLSERIRILRGEFEACRDNCQKTRKDLDSLYSVYNTFHQWVIDNIYTKDQVYNKNEVYTQAQTNDLIQGVKNLFVNYYSKTQVDSIINNYYQKGDVYTKTEVDSLIDAIKSALANEIEAKMDTLSDYVTAENLAGTLTEFYDKHDIDSIINNLPPAQNIIYGDTTIINNYITYGDTTIINNYITYGDTTINNITYGDTTIINNITNNYITEGVDSEKVVSIFNEQIESYVKRINELTTVINSVRDLAQTDSVRIDSLELITDGLNTRLTGVENRLTDAEVRLVEDSIKLATLDNLYNELKDSLATYATIEYVDAADQKLNNRIDSILNTVVPELETKINDARTYAEELADSVGNLLTEAIRTVNERIDATNDSIDRVAENLGALKDAYEQYVEENNARVKDVEDRLDDVEDRLNTVESDIQDIQNRIEKIENSMVKFISGITLNGTENPVFGEFSLPADVRSNVLAVYHGWAPNGVVFPADDETYYSSSADFNRITKADWDEVLKNVNGAINDKAAQVLVTADGKEGNAGTLYLTVNPTNRDFTGTEFTMINSQNEESNVQLSPLKKSDKVIKFGWNRARQEGEQSSNGFYEAKATISKLSVQTDPRIRLNLDLAGSKEVLNDVKNWQNGISATDLVTTLYQNVHNLLEADAVKATWTDDVTGEEMSVVSQYGIGAATVKPLSFSFMKDYNGKYDDLLNNFVDKFAGKFVDKLQEVLLKYVDKVKVKYETIADYIEGVYYEGYGISEYYYADGTPVSDADFEMLGLSKANQFKFTVKLPAGALGDDEKKVWNDDHSVYQYVWQKQADGSFLVHLQISAADDVMDSLARVFDGEDGRDNKINKLIDAVKKITEEVNEFLGLIENDLNNLTSTFGLDKIFNYVDIVNSHLNRWLEPNKYVQPLLLIHNNDGYKRISRSSRKASKVSTTTFTLIPTTYNVEVLSPAYKKLIVATRVLDSDNQNNVAARDAFNGQENINTVIDGEWQNFDVTIEKGYTYEILYMALDYSGQIAARKYYVKAK